MSKYCDVFQKFQLTSKMGFPRKSQSKSYLSSGRPEDLSFTSTPINPTQRIFSPSVHDLHLLESNTDSAETGIPISSRKALYFNRRNQQRDDSVTARSLLDSMQDGRAISWSHLTLPMTSNPNSRSCTHSNSSQDSMEYPNTSSRRPPEPLQGFIMKNRIRPMKGWHEQFFSLKNGCLSFAKNQSPLSRGRNTTQIDLANTDVEYEVEKLQIRIDTSAVVYHLKFKDSQMYRQWMAAIKEHRAFDQFQRALKSTDRPGAIQRLSRAASNLSCNRIKSTDSSDYLPVTPDGASAQLNPNKLKMGSVQSTNQSKNLKQECRLSGEHLEALKNLIEKLKSIHSNLQNAHSEMLESYSPTEVKSSSPTPSQFFSPLTISSSEINSASKKSAHSRFSSISSMTSLYTAVQATPTLMDDPQPRPEQRNSVKKPNSFILAAANFSDEAKKFTVEANSVLTSIQRMYQYLNSAMSVSKERISTLTPNSKPRNSLNGRTDSYSDLMAAGVDDLDASLSDDIPVLNESNMNVPDMKGVVMEVPEHIAGRRTSLPAQQSTPTALSMLTLLKNNFGRELSKLRLPAILNEPLSVLQNLCEKMEYSQLLDTAAEMSDKTQRMLYVTTFVITGLTNKAYRKATKSFNPLLGETFECIRPEKKWRFLAEQVSLNPPTSAAHCESKLWIFDEEYCAKYRFWGKSLEINALGECQVYFPKWRETYTWNAATTSLTNLTNPTVRTLDRNNSITIQCSNGVTSSIRFGKLNGKDSNADRNVFGTIKPLGDSRESPRMVYGHWDKILVSRDENKEDRCIWRAYPMPSNAQFFYGFTQFAIELNEPPAQDAISSGRLPITDTRRRPDIRLLELGRVEEAEAENKRLEDDQRRRLRSYSFKDKDRNCAWKPFWFTHKTKTVNSPENGSSYEFNPTYWRYHESGGFKDLNLPVLW